MKIYELNQKLYNEEDLDNVKKEIRDLFKENPLSGNKEQEYYHLKYLHLYAKYLEKKSRYKHAISCLHTGRLFLENASLHKKYRSLYANYLSLLTVCYFHDDNQSVVVSKLINQHPFWTTQKNNLLKKIPALLCLYQQYENESKAEKADSVFKEARSLANLSQYILQLNISRYYNDYFLRGSTDGVNHL
ncbi:MAG: hypothetical protein IPK46_04145 [Saprospiraceae bacterium]|nr:hypothetical protein [Saprospiraceae bacterium]